MTATFTITFDYLCPFARNANEHVLTGLEDGADWDVRFTPYSLSQGHVEAGEPALWERDDRDEHSGVLALQVGLAVRDLVPNRFLAAHRALFAARHDAGRDIGDRMVLAATLRDAGVDGDEILARVDTGEFATNLAKEHQAAVDEHGVWGVPTVIAGDRAVFVRVMDRPDGDTARARRRIERIVDLVVEEPMLHEFKQTVLPA